MATQRKTGNLFFIGIGRVSDGTPLAWMNREGAQTQENPEDVFRKLLAAAKMRMHPGQRTRLQWHQNSFCCLMSDKGDLLAAAVTADMEYPERYVYQMLREVFQSLIQQEGLDSLGEGGLTNQLSPVMAQKLDQYDNYHALQGTIEESTPDLAGVPSLSPANSRPGRSVLRIGTGLAFLCAVAAVVWFFTSRGSSGQALRGLME